MSLRSGSDQCCIGGRQEFPDWFGLEGFCLPLQWGHGLGLGSLEVIVTTFYSSRMLAAAAPCFPQGRLGCHAWCCVRGDSHFTKRWDEGFVWDGLDQDDPASSRGWTRCNLLSSLPALRLCDCMKMGGVQAERCMSTMWLMCMCGAPEAVCTVEEGSVCVQREDVRARMCVCVCVRARACRHTKNDAHMCERTHAKE